MTAFTPVACPKCGSTNVDAAEAASTQLRCLAAGHVFEHPNPDWYREQILAPAGLVHGRATEGDAESIGGKRSANDVRRILQAAVQDRLIALGGETDCWVYVVDWTDDSLVYSGHNGQYQCGYTLGDDGTVTLGDATPSEEVVDYKPAPAGGAGAGGAAASADEGTAEARHSDMAGRVVEAKGTDGDGNRIFGVRIIAYGDSKNGRRYPQAVLEAATAMYEGAKVYDHHRTEAEFGTSSIAGLVGTVRSVEALEDGLAGDLHLLPSAKHAAEAFDASLAAQEAGLPPLIGISHDVYATWRPVVESGRRLQEAVAITKVNSVDVVADPAAGGQATRMVAGGHNPNDPAGTVPGGEITQESNVTINKDDLLAAMKDLTPEDLSAVGLTKAEQTPAPSTESTSAPAGEQTTEAQGLTKASFVGKLAVRSAVEDAKLPAGATEAITAQLGDTFTEAQLGAVVNGYQAVVADLERQGLAPAVGNVEVTQEAMDKKIAALDAMFDGDYSKGYRSFKEAFVDVTGRRPKSFDEDFNKTILRESIGSLYDSQDRAQESLNAASWAQVLGDSITRRMMAAYELPTLQSWRKVVSSIVPVNDFRTQRIGRIGGYGALPAVAEGGSYTSLTSPGDEEATYAITKRGGTEDITLEMIANDDLRSIVRIPVALGRAAAQTLYRFVWDILPANAVTSYDAVALFAVGHANTATAALSAANLEAGRLAMRTQTAYGAATEVLGATPKFLVVPAALEPLAFQLATSAVAVTSNADATIPNLHQGIEPVVVDYYSDANDWFLVADPAMVPTIEVGFYQGREDPELFTQADPTVGSMFTADKLTFKVRHIYSGTALDHRGLYRGTI